MRIEALALCIVAIVPTTAFSDTYTEEQLRRAVHNNDLALIGEWLKQSESDISLTQEVFLQAVEEQRLEVLTSMIESGIDPNSIVSGDTESALYVAAKNGSEPIIELLLKGGATPLPTSEQNEWQADHMIQLALEKSNNRFFRLCLDLGLSPDYVLKDQDEDSLLDLSVKVSNFQAFKMLINYKADIRKVRMENGYRSILAVAIELQGEKSDYVKLLKSMGAYNSKYDQVVPPVGVSQTDRLRIRQSPTLSSKVVGYLSNGEYVEILEVTPLTYTIDTLTAPWIRISKGDLKGWVFGGYLKGSYEFSGQSP